jgi:hypothetical protein
LSRHREADGESGDRGLGSTLSAGGYTTTLLVRVTVTGGTSLLMYLVTHAVYSNYVVINSRLVTSDSSVNFKESLVTLILAARAGKKLPNM